MDFLSPDRALVLSDPKGTTYLWRPAPRISVSRVVGALTPEGAKAIAAAIQRTIAEDGRHVGFHDWEAMTGYDFSDRLMLTAAVGRILDRLDGLHFLTGSRVVRYGVEGANLILKRLTVHPSREAFERELVGAVARRR